ncbi:DUF5017 domain-containing protein [Pseudopedobacter sp.]|uniref:DUF5017 domain-containing protein n=1 Tax=Pseudopedobacter sp. TaxID=1936787 RepID=UPI00333FEA42
MKTNFFYIILLIVALSSCTKETEKMSPGTIKIIPFDAKLSTTEFKVGEPVNFQMQGNADTILFYSGEFGKDYNYIKGREVTIEKPTLTIRTNSNYGEQKSLSILLSQNFNGDYSYSGINAATWKDMTSKFNIPTPTGATAINFTSAPVEITEFIEVDKPYYIAVRNDIKTSSTGNRPTQWYFYGTNGFAFTGLVNGSPTDISAFGDMGWKIAVNGYLGGELDGTRGPRVSPNNSSSPTSLFLARNSTSTEAMDAWAVTKVFSSKTNLGPDKGTIIKSAETALPLEKYTYMYSAPGEYNVTFQGRNKDGGRTLVQQKITVIP